MTAAGYARARRALMQRDPVLAAIIAKYGSCPLATAVSDDIYSGLIEAIVSQQLSVRAAATIYGRVRALLAPAAAPTPAAVLDLTEESLRAAGLSRQKVSYVRDLSRKILDGSLPADRLTSMTDAEVIGAVTQVKGIGRWSADMILIFRLLRPDILPVGDLGIVKAVQKAYGLRKAPTPERLIEIGERWRPYRSVASWYLWASLDNKPLPERRRKGL